MWLTVSDRPGSYSRENVTGCLCGLTSDMPTDSCKLRTLTTLYLQIFDLKDKVNESFPHSLVSKLYLNLPKVQHPGTMPSYSGDPKAQDPASYSNGMTGSCLCGIISVTITKSNLFTMRNGHLCHCSNCRKVTGAIAANNLVVEQSNVQIQDPKGFLKTYEDRNNASGLPARRSFCSNCGRYVPFGRLVLLLF